MIKITQVIIAENDEIYLADCSKEFSFTQFLAIDNLVYERYMIRRKHSSMSYLTPPVRFFDKFWRNTDLKDFIKQNAKRIYVVEEKSDYEEMMGIFLYLLPEHITFLKLREEDDNI